MPGMTDRAELDVVVCDDAATGLLKEHGPVRLIKNPNVARIDRLRNVFVLCSAGRLREISNFVSSVNKEHRLRALFVRQDADPAWLPQLLERANLRAVRNMIVHQGYSLPNRVLSAWEHGAQDRLIANATVVNGKLLLISCALEVLEVSFDALPALKRISERERESFVVAKDGSYIHWPGPDIHLDLEAIKSAVDPIWRARAEAARLSHNRLYGQAIGRLRKKHGLTQSDIPGLSGRHVRRIERGGPVTGTALRSMAAAHGLSLDDYLVRVAKHVKRPRSAPRGDEGAPGAVARRQEGRRSGGGEHARS